MGVITDIINKVKELACLPDGELIGVHSNNLHNGEEKIKYRLRNYRLTPPASNNFHIKFGLPDKANLFNFSLSEFPNCCGKGILHAIVIGKNVESPNGTNTLSEDSYLKLVELVLELAKGLFAEAQYSSFDFIISDNDNPDIYYAMKKMDIKPVASWRNSRYSASHNCNNYTISMVKTEDPDYLEKSRIVVIS
jgi:hypothetical protein